MSRGMNIPAFCLKLSLKSQASGKETVEGEVPAFIAIRYVEEKVTAWQVFSEQMCLIWKRR